jgi:ABC-type phosphate/phosphonate transport system permease subunit
MAAGAALFALWGGKMEKWRPPDEDLPGAAQAIVLLLCGVGMVMQWYFAVPATIGWFFGVIGILAVTCVICFLQYSGLLGAHIYIKKEATGPKSTRDVRILGGNELQPEAEKMRKKNGVDIQTLLQGAAYNPDLLWSRESRRRVKQKTLLLFILTLVLGTSALTGASFATQVLLTKKAAASVIRTTDAPGLEKKL